MGRLDKGFQALKCMLKDGTLVPERVLGSLLDTGHDLEACRFVHYSMRVGCPGSVLVSGPLIRLLAVFHSLLDANLVFCQVVNPTVHTWQAIIFAHHANGESLCAVNLYHKMASTGIRPNRFVFSCVLRACASIGRCAEALVVHEHIITCGLDEDVVLGSTLIDMYAKGRNVKSANKIFDRLKNRNVVSWNALITGYVQNEESHKALELFHAMQVGIGIIPNKVTFLCALKACNEIGDVKKGMNIHQQVIKMGLDTDVVVGNTVIDMYTKWGCLIEAMIVLNYMPNRNVVSWSAIISGAARYGDRLLVSWLYDQMRREGISPDRVVLIGLLNACGQAEDIEHGSLIHDQILERGFGSDLVVRGALIDMYAKCKKLNDARRVFDEASNQTLMLWGLMITGYTQHGEGLCALELYEKMQESGVKPDKFLFSCLLNACGDLGALEQGRILHGQMGEYQVKLDTVIGNTLIDMYAKCGDFTKAHEVFDELMYRDDVSWGLMISRCVRQGSSSRLAIQCVKDMKRKGVIPNDMLCARLLSACSHAGQTDEGQWQLNFVAHTYPLSSNTSHYTSIVDLLGYVGCLEVAKSVLQTMPLSPNAINWMSLLSRCRSHGDWELGKHCSDQIMQLDAKRASYYNLSSKTCVDLHMWNDARLHESRGLLSAWRMLGGGLVEVSKAVQKLHPQLEDSIISSRKLETTMEGLEPQNDSPFKPSLHNVMQNSLFGDILQENCVHSHYTNNTTNLLSTP